VRLHLTGLVTNLYKPLLLPQVLGSTRLLGQSAADRVTNFIVTEAAAITLTSVSAPLASRAKKADDLPALLLR
jgi:hypothetical protein